MRRTRNLLFATLTALGLASATGAAAQTWTGHAPADVTGQEVYLYNVGTGLFLNEGGTWGTEAVTSDVGMGFTIAASGSGYTFTSTVRAEGHESEPGKLGQVNVSGTDAGSYDDNGKIFTDRYDSSNFDFVLTQVGSTGYIYSLKIDDDYISAVGLHQALSLSTEDNSSADANAQWQLVTLADRQDYFRNTVAANASDASPADGTFVIYDQNFTRKNLDISYWKTGSDKSGTLINGTEDALPSGHECKTITTTTYTYSGTCTHTYDSVYYTGSGRWPWTENTKSTTYTHNVTYTTTDYKGESLDTVCGGGSITYSTGYKNPYKTETFSSGSITLNLTNTETTTTTQDVTTYYVGNGYGDPGKNAHTGDTADSISIAKGQMQRAFGDYWTANIHGDGVITQEYTTETAGWYIISCDGFTTQEGKAKLFFRSSGTGDHSSATTDITYIETAPATYTLAGQLLQSSTDYNHTAMIYVNAGETISFGVEVSGADCATWTCVDNFQIHYTGDNDMFLVLSELRTDMDYINAQVDSLKSYTMILERNLKANQWNSLILPVSMTVQQFKQAFGSSAKLSTIQGIDTSVDEDLIVFKSVALSNEDSTAIKAGTLYIVKPTKAPQEEAGAEFKVQYRTATDGHSAGDTLCTIKTEKPYYLINQMVLAAAPETTDGMVEQTGVPGNDELGGLTFKGTYTWQTDSIIPVGSILLSTNTGRWYQSQSKKYPVKGFRTWIETGASQATSVAISFDGVEDKFDNIITSIQGLENDLNITTAADKVYNLNGQLVRSGSASLEGLAKGVYIVNGKKYIVK